MTILNELAVEHIKYTSAHEGVSERYVIPVSVPSDYIRTLDVTDYTEEERKHLVDAYAEYKEYVKLHMSKMFNFENWHHQVYGSDVEDDYRLKWRNLTASSVEKI